LLHLHLSLQLHARLNRRAHRRLRFCRRARGVAPLFHDAQLQPTQLQAQLLLLRRPRRLLCIQLVSQSLQPLLQLFHLPVGAERYIPDSHSLHHRVY
ncbi:MAG: hypothetical protein SGPRY_005838, partial [Prymnesium sp.]